MSMLSGIFQRAVPHFVLTGEDVKWRLGRGYHGDRQSLAWDIPVKFHIIPYGDEGLCMVRVDVDGAGHIMIADPELPRELTALRESRYMPWVGMLEITSATTRNVAVEFTFSQAAKDAYQVFYDKVKEMGL